MNCEDATAKKRIESAYKSTLSNTTTVSDSLLDASMKPTLMERQNCRYFTETQRPFWDNRSNTVRNESLTVECLARQENPEIAYKSTMSNTTTVSDSLLDASMKPTLMERQNCRHFTETHRPFWDNRSKTVRNESLTVECLVRQENPETASPHIERTIQSPSQYGV
jgi:hypothetical protein